MLESRRASVGFMDVVHSLSSNVTTKVNMPWTISGHFSLTDIWLRLYPISGNVEVPKA